MGVTIHHQMDRLEDVAVITGYTTNVDLDRMDLQLYSHNTRTASISDHSDVAEKAPDLPQVLEATELMTGQENPQVKAIGVQDGDTIAIAEQLDSLALATGDENLIREEHIQSIDYVELADILEAEQAPRTTEMTERVVLVSQGGTGRQSV